MRYGYIRVSRANADGSTTLGNQRRQLAAADVDHLFEDVVSGLAASRPGLDELLDVVQAGDTVVVVALDRLGRDFMHSVGLLQTFADRGVDRQVMNLPTDVADVAGAKLREGTTTILPRGSALQGVGLSSMRFHPIGGGPKTTKTDKKHGSRQESHPLLDRPEIDWPCRISR